MPIDASVGTYRNGTKQCYNLPKDQLRIANLLDLIGTGDGGTDGTLMLTIQKLRWGVVDQRLEQAIQAFQKKQFGFTDGHVDPGEKTIRKLEELAFRNPAAPPPAPTASTPPGVSNVPSITPDVLPPSGPGTFETWGPRMLDIASFGLDFLGLFGELLASIIGGLLAEILSPILAILSALLSAPLAWRSGDKAAYFNGYLPGYWQAMSDMAYAFRDKNLDYLIPVKITPPESVPKGPRPDPMPVWPQIPIPQPHMSVVSDSQIDEFERQNRKGQQDGCKAAYDLIMKLESSPKTSTTQQGGRQIQIVADGKVTLRLLYSGTNGSVFSYLRDATNKELKKRGKSEWPTH